MNVRRWRLPLIWAGVILIITSIPHAQVPQALDFGGVDKVAHFTMYAVFALLLARAAIGTTWLMSWRTLLSAVAVASVFGALDEWHQAFIPGRSADVRDWQADSAGAFAGVAVAAALRRRRLIAT